MSWTTPWALGLLPAVWLLAAVAELRRAARLRALLAAVGAPLRGRVESTRGALVAGAASLLVVGLAGPSPGAGPAPSSPSGGGGDLLLVMDVSGSMSVRDALPDRAGAARRAALRLVGAGAGERVGVAAFAAEAHLLLPPTADRGLVETLLASLDPGVATARGSELARALRLAVEATARPGGEGSVVMVSDGEGFQSAAALDSAVAEARRAGVAVHAVGVGSEEGGTVPGAGPGAWSRARPDDLRALASATGGRFVEAGDGPALDRLADALRPSAPLPAPPGDTVPPVRAWLAGAALLALAVEWALGRRRRG